MRFFSDKPCESRLKDDDINFAWFPIWVWDSREQNYLTLVWLENVRVCIYFHIKKPYYILINK